MRWRGPIVWAVGMIAAGCSVDVAQDPNSNIALQTGGGVGTGGVLNQLTGGTGPILTGGVLNPTGGVMTTGGILNPTGGIAATGGVLASGGTAVTGGIGATGGAAVTGGIGATGGTAATGGTSSSGIAPVIPAVSGECPTFRDGTITFMGLSGIRIVAGAKPAGPTAPMVFYWHGTGSNSGEFASLAGAVSAGVVAQGGVLVSFQGTTGGDLRSGTSIFGAGDYELADQLVACAVRDHNVDPRRIFATGCSAGGLFSAAMAAERSTYMAAAAPNSGGMVVQQRFEGGASPALMTIHGAPGVDVVVVDFSETSATADTSFKANGGFVINCNHGGRHCGGGPLAADIWQFFEAHPYGTKPDPWASGLPAGFDSSCEIF